MGNSEQAHPPSFDEVYESLFPTVYGVSLRITGDKEVAEDLCQEAFIKLMERTNAIPDLDQSKFWLIRVVKNLSFNYEKKKGREKAAFKKLTQLSTGVSDSGEKQVIEEEVRTDVQRALDALPYNFRVPLVFREYADLSYKEIAAILGISESNVKVRIFRARERLEKVLNEGKNDVS
jgi:RNA polymerase sigma-70 factor (ECF subfamily)